ncbi:MAG: metallophosphoesterase family protein [Candidatus Hodarchaeales archaeon]
MVKIFFCTDIHGAENAWKKFLNAGKYLKADMLILGGDITGKRIVPVIEQPNGTWTGIKYGRNNREVIMKNKCEVKDFEEYSRSIGHYTCPITPEENKLLSSPESIFTEDGFSKPVKGGSLDKLFDRLISESLHRWLNMIDDVMSDGTRRVPEGIKVILCTGNDDSFIVDEIIKKDHRVALGDERNIDLDGKHEMISYGWTTPTPWNSYRETTEDIIKERINKLTSTISDLDNSIFCFHCPPYNTLLDKTLVLRPRKRSVRFGSFNSIGSKSVKQAIQKYQPLLSLHGHVHKLVTVSHSSGCIKIGRTHCMNPGSEYYANVLKGFLIELNNGGIAKIQKVQS